MTGKSERKNNAITTVFKSNEGGKDSVRVGYIDKNDGFISGLSVYQANKYAEKNPGTQFIFQTRDAIRYLNINEVNKLTNRDTLPIQDSFSLRPNGTDLNPCDTVEGLQLNVDFDPNEDVIKDCKPQVFIEGGYGVGAYGSPIIGEDGSVMHIRVVSGGFGYKIPPQVRVVDACKLGSGAKAFAVLGSTGVIEETYDDVDDVEEYDFNTLSPLSLT